MIVVSDNGALAFLVQLGRADLLLALYDRVAIPPAVRDELLHEGTPESVRRWMAAAPDWLEVRTPIGDPEREVRGAASARPFGSPKNSARRCSAMIVKPSRGRGGKG